MFNSPFECVFCAEQSILSVMCMHLLSSVSIFHALSNISIVSDVAVQCMSAEPSNLVFVMS